MNHRPQKPIAWVLLIVVGVGLFVYLDKGRDASFAQRFDASALIGLTPAQARERLGEPSTVRDDGATWAYTPAGGEAILFFENGRLARLKIDQRSPER